MTDIERLRRDLEELRGLVHAQRNRIEAFEKIVRDLSTKHMELQGKITTVAGRMHMPG